MKLKFLLLVFMLFLMHQTGSAQTEYTPINKAWAALSKAYRLRNESMMHLADTLLNRQAISSKAHSNLSKQIRTFDRSLNSTAPLDQKRTGSIAQKDDKLALSFGKLILVSGPKAPDHYYIEELEAFENRIVLYKRIFNDACTENGRKDLLFPVESAPEVKF